MPVRRILLVLSLLGFAAISGFTIWSSLSTPKPKDLAEPLSAEEAADMTTALPAIDEIRRVNGSVLEGTLLDEIADSGPVEPHENDAEYVALLRREARRLEAVAADKEDDYGYKEADSLRSEAGRLRQTARELDRQSTFTITVNR